MVSLFFALIVCAHCSGAEISGSVVPIVHALETGKGIDPQKYSKTHYQEILSALKCVDSKIRVATFNLLFDIHDAKIAEENRWPNRLPRIVQALNLMQADIVSIQELQLHQVEQLLNEIGGEYSFHFIPSFDPNQTASQDYDGILYRKSRFELLDGKNWSVVRLCKNTLITMGKFLDKKTKKEFSVFNAHFPSWNPDEGERTAREMAQIVKPYAEKGSVIVTGDMNTIETFPDLDKLPWYGGERIESIMAESSLVDSRRKSLMGHVGPFATFTNGNHELGPFTGYGVPGVILDHIFVSKDMKVLIHAVDPVQIGGHFPSDHMPVFVDVLIGEPEPSQ